VCHVTPQVLDSVTVLQTTGGGHATLGGRLTVIMSDTFTPGMSFILVHTDAGLGTTEFRSYSIMSPSNGTCVVPRIAYPVDNDNIRRNVNLVLDPCLSGGGDDGP